jgi:hypothetical protein
MTIEIKIPSKDIEVFRSHRISQDETDAYFGDDDSDTLRDILRKVANYEYSVDELRYNILRYNELID